MRFELSGHIGMSIKTVLKDDQGNPVIKNGEYVFTEVQELDFPNLILDAGLNRIGTGNAIEGVCIGTGNTAPSVEQGSLVSFSKATWLSQGAVESTASTTSPYYSSFKRTFRFNVGELSGNYSEVGVGWGIGGGGNSIAGLFSRALIKDALGNPTTITVSADQVLDVSYTLKLYPPQNDITGSITLNGEVYNYTLRPAYINTRSYAGWTAASVTSTPGFWDAVRCYSGNIGSVTAEPSGTVGFGGATPLTYVNNSYKKEFNITFGLNDGNVGGIRSFWLKVAGINMQAEFSKASDGSPIPKTASKVLTLPFWVSWGRYNAS